MTVTTIGNIPPEIKRALDNQNRNAQSAEQTKARAANSASASLPTDRIVASIQPQAVPGLISYEEAIVQTQVQNREALRSSLSDADIDALTQPKISPQAAVQQQAKASISAQTNKLPANLLLLLNE